MLDQPYDPDFSPLDAADLAVMPGDRLAAGHFAGSNNIVINARHHVDGQRKPDALVAAALRRDHGVDPDHFAADVEQRTAAVARIDGGVGLQEILVHVHVQAGASLGADDAMRDGAGQPERGADRQHAIADLHRVGVAEFQRRGLAHFHVVLRADGPGEPFSRPPLNVTTEMLASGIKSVVKDFAVSSPRGNVSWGRQFQVADASTLNRDDLRIAAYVAKYATKSADGSLDFARRFNSRSEILNSTPLRIFNSSP